MTYGLGAATKAVYLCCVRFLNLIQAEPKKPCWLSQHGRGVVFENQLGAIGVASLVRTKLQTPLLLY